MLSGGIIHEAIFHEDSERTQRWQIAMSEFESRSF